MVYYTPTPEHAYESIVRLDSAISFGWLFRDLHRFAGEAMVFSCSLHLLLVFIHGKCDRNQTMTWISGMALMLCTFILAFTGYLLPWDQLAYWAVTIGVSIAEQAPLVGPSLVAIFRAGSELGADGLLRFYLLHIAGVPALLFIFFFVHYYHISKNNRRSVPPSKQQAQSAKKQITYPLSAIAFREISLILWTTFALLAIITFYYNAPLEAHSNPNITPHDTQAPWFFLWVQGGLKLGDSILFGVIFPSLVFLILFFLPFFYNSFPLFLKKKSTRIGVVFVIASALLALTILGTSHFGISHHPVTGMLNSYFGDDHKTLFHTLKSEDLKVGIYELSNAQAEPTDNHFHQIINQFSFHLRQTKNRENYHSVHGVILVEDWQIEMKRIVLRVFWQENVAQSPVHTAERTIYVHAHGK